MRHWQRSLYLTCFNKRFKILATYCLVKDLITQKYANEKTKATAKTNALPSISNNFTSNNLVNSQENHGIGVQSHTNRPSTIVDSTTLTALRRAIPIKRQPTHGRESCKGSEEQQSRPPVVPLRLVELELLREFRLSSTVLLLWRWWRRLAIVWWLLCVLLWGRCIVLLLGLIPLRRILRLIVIILRLILHAIRLSRAAIVGRVVVGVGLTTVDLLVVRHLFFPHLRKTIYLQRDALKIYI